MLNRFSNLMERLRALNPRRDTPAAAQTPAQIAQTIERALAKAGLRGPAAANEPVAGTSTGPRAAQTRPVDDDNVIDVEFRTLEPEVRAPAQGQFMTRSYTNPAGMRDYKLYVPANLSARFGRPTALVVMLHGCTQSPDDFAAGTRMNEMAEQLGMLVVYPQQTGRANTSQCWNWFRPQDQQRERGEPSLIAGIAREVASQYDVAAGRIFVAGLSAGAAMAVILGQTYPDLFAAVGAHSGLAYGVAHDVASALGAMKGSAAMATPGIAAPAPAHSSRRTPTIVFHGDSDRTVVLSNGAAIVDQVTKHELSSGALRASTHAGTTGNGRSYTRQVFHDARQNPVAEYWVLHGSGHAWSGGSTSGSFTDPHGPDASSEMVRFFRAQNAAG